MELSSSDTECPSCKKRLPKTFTIMDFLWENFRLFTLIGVTGTMISLIPMMGSRILGESWITHSDQYLPLLLSIIIFFGTIFLTICFLMIFNLIFRGRADEAVRSRIAVRSGSLTWHDGDSQRFVLLFCLVPMWCGLTLFFILMMPLITNNYSWMFAIVTVLTCIPLALYSFLGWKLGKTATKLIPGLRKFPRLSVTASTVLVIVVLLLAPFALPAYFGNTDTFSGDVRIRADTQYFSPHISSAKGLQLSITNLSGRELLASRHTWSADYGYFIRIIPSTGDVTILGNPVIETSDRDIYWTFSQNNLMQHKEPVKIDLQFYPLHGSERLINSSLYLTWYTDDIVYVNDSFEPRK